KELKKIDRQLAFYYLDIVMDRFRRVGRKAEDIAAIGNYPLLFPGKQHLPIVRDLVLAFLGPEQRIGVDVLQPDKYALHARPFTLFDKVRQFMTKGIDLDNETDL